MSRFATRSLSSIRPSVECLEGRACPAGIGLSNGVLSISGSDAADTVTVTQDDANNEIWVQDGRQTVIFFSSRVSTVSVGLDDGVDNFTYRLASDYTRLKHVSVWLGGDDDHASFDFGAGNAWNLDANLYLSFAGMGGNDTLQADFGDFQSTSSSPRLEFWADMGNGNDTANVSMNGRLSGAGIARIDLIGNSNNDTLSFNQAGDIDSSASLDLVMDGGWGDDTVSASYTGVLDGSCHARLDGGIRGNDRVTGEMNIQSGSSGTLDVEAYGGTGTDSMGLEIFTDPNDPLVIARALLDGGSGLDNLLDTTLNVTVVNL